MDSIKKLTFAADLFMMQLMVKGEDAVDLILPKVLLPVYQGAAMQANVRIECYEIEDDERLFNLIFSNSVEQNKLWDLFYEFNHSGQRAYALPNFYDQISGELLNEKLNEFTKNALLELMN